MHIFKNPFILILSKYRHDSTVSPLTFVAFHFDGSRGFAVKPNVYHQAVFPLKEQVHMKSIQGKIHGVVMMDAYREFGVYMRIPKAFEPVTDLCHNHWLLSMHSKVIPIESATESNMNLFGSLINEFNPNLVQILKWPARQRPVWMGDENCVQTQKTVYQWDCGGLMAIDDLELGLRSDNGPKFSTNCLISRIDGSHIVFPNEENEAFFILFAYGMSTNTEEVDPETFTALMVPSGKGVLIRAKVWHSAPFPLTSSKMTFMEAFSSVNARIEDDLFASFGFVINCFIVLNSK